MPKNLTDVSQWVTISVPVDTDVANAASVETPLQIIADRTRLLLSARSANWKPADVSALTSSWTGSTPKDVCFDRSLGGYTALALNGETVYSYHPNDGGATKAIGGGGLIWTPETTNPRTRGYTGYAIACDHNGVRIVTYASSNVERSTALNTWSNISVGGGTFAAIDHDDNSLWAVAATNGLIKTSPSGSTWTSRTSGLTDSITCLRHTHNSSDPVWLAITPTKSSTSADGITWVATAHSLSANPVDYTLKHSNYEDKWMVMLTNRNIAYSTNDGQTWSEYTDPLGIGSGTFNADNVSLESDDLGTWIAHYMPGGTSTDRRWVSLDNGATWTEVYEGMSAIARLKFGDDMFVSVGKTEADYSLRMIGV